MLIIILNHCQCLSIDNFINACAWVVYVKFISNVLLIVGQLALTTTKIPALQTREKKAPLMVSQVISISRALCDAVIFASWNRCFRWYWPHRANATEAKYKMRLKKQPLAHKEENYSKWNWNVNAEKFLLFLHLRAKWWQRGYHKIFVWKITMCVEYVCARRRHKTRRTF